MFRVWRTATSLFVTCEGDEETQSLVLSLGGQLEVSVEHDRIIHITAAGILFTDASSKLSFLPFEGSARALTVPPPDNEVRLPHMGDWFAMLRDDRVMEVSQNGKKSSAVDLRGKPLFYCTLPELQVWIALTKAKSKVALEWGGTKRGRIDLGTWRLETLPRVVCATSSEITMAMGAVLVQFSLEENGSIISIRRDDGVYSDKDGRPIAVKGCHFSKIHHEEKSYTIEGMLTYFSRHNAETSIAIYSNIHSPLAFEIRQTGIGGANAIAAGTRFLAGDDLALEAKLRRRRKLLPEEVEIIHRPARKRKDRRAGRSLVFLHGGPFESCGNQWSPFFRTLSAHFDSIRVPLFRHSISGHAPRNTTEVAKKEDLENLARGLEQEYSKGLRFVVCGHSFGAFLASELRQLCQFPLATFTIAGPLDIQTLLEARPVLAKYLSSFLPDAGEGLGGQDTDVQQKESAIRKPWWHLAFENDENYSVEFNQLSLERRAGEGIAAVLAPHGTHNILVGTHAEEAARWMVRSHDGFLESDPQFLHVSASISLRQDVRKK